MTRPAAAVMPAGSSRVRADTRRTPADRGTRLAPSNFSEDGEPMAARVTAGCLPRTELTGTALRDLMCWRSA